MLLGQKTYTVTRQPAVEYAGGVVRTPVGVPDTTFDIVATVRPLDDRTIDALPEGLRERARWRFYTQHADRLNMHDPESGTLPDLIAVGGESLHVFALSDNDDALVGSPINHRRYVLLLPKVAR